MRKRKPICSLPFELTTPRDFTSLSEEDLAALGKQAEEAAAFERADRVHKLNEAGRWSDAKFSNSPFSQPDEDDVNP